MTNESVFFTATTTAANSRMVPLGISAFRATLLAASGRTTHGTTKFRLLFVSRLRARLLSAHSDRHKDRHGGLVQTRETQEAV